MSDQVTVQFGWFEAQVERCLADLLNGAELVVDDDGDYVIGWEPPGVYVRVRSDGYWSVEVFTCAAMGLRPRLAVLREINQLNARFASATGFLTSNGSVIIRQRLHCESVTANALRQAVTAVGGAAQDVGVLMASMFDGHSPFSIETAESEGA